MHAHSTQKSYFISAANNLEPYFFFNWKAPFLDNPNLSMKFVDLKTGPTTA